MQVGERLLELLDRAELLAFNALPGTTTSDLWQVSAASARSLIATNCH